MPDAPRRGITAKLFGVILMALGALNSMLSWRGGLADTDFHFGLLACGVLVYLAGAIRGAGPSRT